MPSASSKRARPIILSGSRRQTGFPRSCLRVGRRCCYSIDMGIRTRLNRLEFVVSGRYADF